MTDLDLDAIEALTNAATPGPWQHDGDDGLVWAQCIGDPVSGSNEMADADFIAAARTVVPALVAEVKRLRAELATPAPALVDEPDGDVERVIDRDGDMWVRHPEGWCYRGHYGDGTPTKWSEVQLYAPITTVKPKAAGQ